MVVITEAFTFPALAKDATMPVTGPSERCMDVDQKCIPFDVSCGGSSSAMPNTFWLQQVQRVELSKSTHLEYAATVVQPIPL